MPDKEARYIKVLEQRILFDHPMAQIIRDIIVSGNREFPYFYLVSPLESVATVGVNPDQHLLLTRQYRHPISQTIYDLPGGRLEPGEKPLEGARREFEEETGYYPKQITPLGIYNQFPGSMRATTHLFFASDLVPSQQRLDEDEVLQVVMLPLDEVIQMITAGEIIDGSLQLGVLLALHKGFLSLHPD